MKNYAAFSALMLATSQPTYGQLHEDLKRQFEEAERQIVRLSPRAFPQLPANLVRYVERQRCTIPQDASSKKTTNVIKGEFAKPGEVDWAVLCSVNGFSDILVVWEEPKTPHRNGVIFSSAKDRESLWLNANNQIGYARSITTVSKDFILQHYHPGRGPTPPLIDHQGIQERFGQGSSVYYYYNGNWLNLDLPTGGN